MGVFQLRNVKSGRVLVGSSVNLPASFNRLKAQLGMGAYRLSRELQADWNELGSDGFAFEVLEELEPPEAPGADPSRDLEAMLELWLEQLEPYGESGYNRRKA